METVTGAWTLKLPSSTKRLVIAKGKISIQGKAVAVISSSNPKYPTSAGWFAFVQKTGELGAARLTDTGEKLEAVIMQGRKVVRATVTQAGLQPGLKIPLESKYFNGHNL